jgi:hypothetical protein
MPAPYARDEPVHVCGLPSRYPWLFSPVPGGPGTGAPWDDRGAAAKRRALGHSDRPQTAVPGPGRADRGRAGGAQPGAGDTGRARYRPDRAAGAWAETAQDFQVSRAEDTGSGWSCRSRRCISCACACWASWTGCPARSATRSRWRPACGRAVRRIVSWSAWPCRACCRRWPPAGRCCAYRRCAVAGPGPSPGAGVHGPPADAESVAPYIRHP